MYVRQALVFIVPCDVRYASYSYPVLATDDSLILKVVRLSVCGSVLHLYHGHSIVNANYR